MQAIVPTPGGSANPNGHSLSTILGALRDTSGVGRQFRFRYDRLSNGNSLLSRLDNVRSCTISQNWLADIKRTAEFLMDDTGSINFLQDRIRPWVRLLLPPYGSQDYVEWPQGVFLLSSPTRHADATNSITRQVQGYDALQVYAEDRTADRYAVQTGTLYTQEVSDLLGPVPKNIVHSTLELPTDREWPPGTAKLKIINELLGAINYQSLSFSPLGLADVRPYVSPQDRPAEYEYLDNADGLIIPDIEQGLDLFSIPNRWVLVVSDPDRPPLVSVYTNTDPASPTSTVSRQRIITDYREEQDAADQTSLDGLAARLAFESSQVFESIDFRTGMLPIHNANDVYSIRYDPLGVNAKYSEHSWSLSLVAGAEMHHTARRVVSI